MIWLLAAHLVAACLAPWLVARMGRNAFLVLALVPLAAVVWAIGHTGHISDGGTVDERMSWVGTLGMTLDMRLDPLSLLMTLVVGGVGALVVAYCARYFSSDSPGLGRFAGVLVAFAGAMLGLVLTDDLLLLYVFWELTTVLSFLLVGHDSDRDGARRAAVDALIVTTFGGLAMLVGAIMVGEAAGTYRISEIVAGAAQTNGGHSTEVTIGVLLLVVGAISKSALVPFHFWLPGAMAAPTPVSAFLHSAAMVKAGVFLVARLAPGFSDVVGWREVLVVLGGITMIAGAWRALRQYDLKLLLAHGTVSQLGFLTLLVGAGTRNAMLAGLGMLLAHALYKSTLFLVVGIIDRRTGTRDLRALSGLGRQRPWLAGVAGLAALSMAGVPPLAGFAAKESAYEAFEHGGFADVVVLVAIVLGAALTAAYAFRFLWGAFGTKPGIDERACGAVPRGFLAPAAVLGAGGLVLGVLLSRVDGLAGRFADGLPAETLSGEAAKATHLAAWHGFGLPLLLTLLAFVVAAGLVRVVAPNPLIREAFLWPAIDARRIYVRILRGTERLAVLSTAATQRGSLPIYMTVILVVVVAASGTALIAGIPWETDVRLWDSPAQGLVVLLLIVTVGFALQARRRLKAVALTGAVGYAVALLYVLQGAPDLALTQFLAETLTFVVLLLVLRRLPTHFTGRMTLRGRRRVNFVIGGLVGTVFALLTAVAMGAREAAAISEAFVHAAEAAGGHNLVNITLVDFRAWDTMGEIAVLVVAATGVTSLVFVRRRTRALPRAADAQGAQVWSAPQLRAVAPTAEVAGPARPAAGTGRPASGAAPGPGGAAAEEDLRSTTGTPDANPLRVSTTPAGGATTARRATAWLRAEETLAPERRSLLLEVVVRLVFHTVLVLSVYLLFAGHDFPGGGFAGGIVAGLALVMRYLAGGRFELGETAPVGAGTLIGLGLVVATGTGLGAVLFGGEILQSAVYDADIPLLGHVHLVSSSLFDVGVYLVVVGVVLDILRSFGSEIDRQEEADVQEALERARSGRDERDDRRGRGSDHAADPTTTGSDGSGAGGTGAAT